VPSSRTFRPLPERRRLFPQFRRPEPARPAQHRPAAATWTARLRLPDGTDHVMHPQHIILSNGTNGIAHIPDLPGLKDFAGDKVHSHGFKSGEPWRGKKARVLGTGNKRP
jgi:cation diffusion facilitator CzcD-associated flavoprotein CzcO